jgi:hypothetical protein
MKYCNIKDVVADKPEKGKYQYHAYPYYNGIDFVSKIQYPRYNKKIKKVEINKVQGNV